jgi:cyanophycinase
MGSSPYTESQNANCSVCSFLAILGTAAAADPPYQYFRTGHPADIHPATQPGFALIGGGKDLDEAFQWMCTRSANGDFLILRATGADAYNPYVTEICHENSVATLIIPNRAAAEDPFVEKKIREAAAIFISGGDQSNYVNFCQNTPVQRALNDAIRRGIPVGGASAGLAIQGEFSYSAQADKPDGPDLTSSAALNDPFHPQVVIVRGFLQIQPLQATIADTHFGKRDRMGRLLVFMARTLDSGIVPIIKAVGLDEHTAVLLERDGRGVVVGTGAAYFLGSSEKIVG